MTVHAQSVQPLKPISVMPVLSTYPSKWLLPFAPDYPYNVTSRTYAPNPRIYGYIKDRFPSSLATAKLRFYMGNLVNALK